MRKKNKKFLSITILVLTAIAITACNLQVVSVPPPQSTPSSFAQVIIPKPSDEFNKWAEVSVLAGQTTEGSTEFEITMTIIDQSKSNLTVAYVLSCDRQESAQSGYIISGTTKISCLGDEYQLTMNNTLVMQGIKINETIKNNPEIGSIILGQIK